MCIIEKFSNQMALASTERILQAIATRVIESQTKRKEQLPSKTFITAYLGSFGEGKCVFM